MESPELPSREALESALEGLASGFVWRKEHEAGGILALEVAIGDSKIALSLIGEALEPKMYEDALEVSGLAPKEVEAIENHAAHARIVYLEEEEPVEAVLRMTLIYQIAARLTQLGSIAILAPASGVFVLGLKPEFMDKPEDPEVPPLDLWVAVEKVSDDKARSVGATQLNIPDVELDGIGILGAEAIFSTVMDMILYLRRIRRELVPGETVHIGRQPFKWFTMRSKDKKLIKLRRVELEEIDS